MHFNPYDFISRSDRQLNNCYLSCFIWVSRSQLRASKVIFICFFSACRESFLVPNSRSTFLLYFTAYSASESVLLSSFSRASASSSSTLMPFAWFSATLSCSFKEPSYFFNCLISVSIGSFWEAIFWELNLSFSYFSSEYRYSFLVYLSLFSSSMPFWHFYAMSFNWWDSNFYSSSYFSVFVHVSFS